MQTDVVDVRKLAENVYALEEEGRQLTEPWYEFEPASSQALARLQEICTESKRTLELMADKLKRSSPERQGEEHHRLEHAYNIVQELLLSRSAVMELVRTVLHEDSPYKEYLRAIALKERAAHDLAAELKAALNPVRD